MYNLSTNISNQDLEKWGTFLTNLLTYDPDWLQIFLSAILVIIFIVGLIGNLIVCTVIYCEKTMHTTTNCYLFNMSVSDVIVSFGIIPDILLVYKKEMNGYSDTTCKLHFSFISLLWNNSILIMTILAIERYIGIWHPLLLKYSCHMRRVTNMIGVIWIIAITETVSEVITMKFMRNNHTAICYSFPTKYSKMINGILALLTFVIPLAIMLFVYISIALKVNNNEKNILKYKIINKKRNKSRVNKLLIAMTLSFLLCWLPYFSLRIFFFGYDPKVRIQVNLFWGLVFKACLINGWLSIVLNPILFSLMSTRFRKALKILWRTKFQKNLRTEIAFV